jgi:sugar phosphate isomerase/epimerase
MKLIPGVILGGPIASREPEDFCALVASAGIAGVEVCTGQLGAAEPEALAGFMRGWDAATAAHGLGIPSLNCSLPPERRDDLRAVFRVAADRGIRIVKVDVSPYESREPYEALLATARSHWAALVPMAREFGLKAVAEVHPRIVCHSPSAMRRMLDGLPPDAVGAILDPGNMVVEGWEDLHEAVDILGPYLAHLHVKNAAWAPDPGQRPPWREIATALDGGLVDWFEACRELARVGFEGFGILEFLRDYMDNREWIARDVAHLMAAAQAAGLAAAGPVPEQ